MFRTITPENRDEYQDLLDDMHRMRYRIVVGEWGWATIKEISRAGPGSNRYATPLFSNGGN